MDIVYVCRSGENEELRYSLRSLVNVPHDNVWVFGDAPDWYTGNLVKVEQAGLKYENAHAGIRAVASHAEVSDDFIYFNDDFYCMKPIQKIKTHYRCSVSELYYHYYTNFPRSTYTRRIKLTAELLRDNYGMTNAKSYELHMPMIFNKEKLAPILKQVQGGFVENGVVKPTLHWRTVYGNVYNVGGTQHDDVKIETHITKHRDWLSSGDATFAIAKPILEWVFPEPSRFERT